MTMEVGMTVDQQLLTYFLFSTFSSSLVSKLRIQLFLLLLDDLIGQQSQQICLRSVNIFSSPCGFGTLALLLASLAFLLLVFALPFYVKNLALLGKGKRLS